MLWGLKQMIADYGSLEAGFHKNYKDNDETILPALYSWQLSYALIKDTVDRKLYTGNDAVRPLLFAGFIPPCAGNPRQRTSTTRSEADNCTSRQVHQMAARITMREFYFSILLPLLMIISHVVGGPQRLSEMFFSLVRNLKYMSEPLENHVIFSLAQRRELHERAYAILPVFPQIF